MKTNGSIKHLIYLGVIAAILLLMSVPFVSKFNYSPFNLLAIEVIPSQEYKIQFDLPRAKSVTPDIREKTEKALSNLFNMKLSDLTNGKLLSRPFVQINKIPATNSYAGLIKIGKVTIPFSKIEEKFNDASKDAETPSRLLLTAYFNLNNQKIRANIFIMNSGSVLQYSSMTLQDENDNVLSMFTYGTAKEQTINKGTQPTSQKTENNNSTNTISATATNGTFKVLKSVVKDIKIEAFGTTRTVHGLRTDAMIFAPFNTNMSVANTLSIRSWGFRQAIIDAYKSIYTGLGFNPSTLYIHLGVGTIDNVIETQYASNCPQDNGNRFPSPSWYSTTPLSIGFSLAFISISYTISMPDGGVRKTWTYKHTVGADVTMNNWAEFTASPFFPYSWNDNNLFWPDNYYSNPYIQNPGSSYGGFYVRQEFQNKANGSGFYARYYSAFPYSISVSIPTYGTDYYYFTVQNLLDNVRLDVQ